MDTCSQLCKCILTLFQVLYSLVGTVLFGVGLWLRFSPNTRESYELSSLFATGVIVLIVLGVVMLFVACCGGGNKRNRSMLAVLLALLAVLIAAQIAVYAKRDEIGVRFLGFYTVLYTIFSLTGDPIVAGILTVLHHTLNCCGAVGVVGLDAVSGTCPNKSGFDVFMSSCITVIPNVFGAKPPLAMAIFFGNGVFLILTLVCAVILIQLLKKHHNSLLGSY